MLSFYSQIGENPLTGQSESGGSLMFPGPGSLMSGPPTASNTTGTTTATTASTAQKRKFTFTSKFNKFNCSCIYDLIEEKDLTEFSSILSKIEANNETRSSLCLDVNNGGGAAGGGLPVFSDIKVYIRFNWYSFNELNMIGTSGNIYFGGSSLPPIAAKTSQKLPFVQQQAQQQQQPINYPFVRPQTDASTSTTGTTTTTSSSGIYMGSSSIGQSNSKLPTPNNNNNNTTNTMSTHSSSSTVYNHPTSASIQALSSKQRQSKI